ncbi:MAG: hypothetical protein JNL84_07340 [Candidatus Accumulibacter sp.]|nr:hypothetical protein [Accumulibacter sp.]
MKRMKRRFPGHRPNTTRSRFRGSSPTIDPHQRISNLRREKRSFITLRQQTAIAGMNFTIAVKKIISSENRQRRSPTKNIICILNQLITSAYPATMTERSTTAAQSTGTIVRLAV